MVIKVSKERYGDGISITFPTTAAQAQKKLAGLEQPAGGSPVFIRGSGLAEHFAECLKLADLTADAGIQKLNHLAGVEDQMSFQQYTTCVGALYVEQVESLDDVLRVASSLDRYEFIEDIPSDEELGRWLVEQGLAGVDFPDAVRPYLDYARVGAEYHSVHGGAYIPQGYVTRRETGQVQAAGDQPGFVLTL